MINLSTKITKINQRMRELEERVAQLQSWEPRALKDFQEANAAADIAGMLFEWEITLRDLIIEVEQRTTERFAYYQTKLGRALDLLMEYGQNEAAGYDRYGGEIDLEGSPLETVQILQEAIK